MAEYEVLVTCTQVYRVYVEAEDDETAETLACKKFWDGDRDPVRDDIDFKIDNVYE